MTNYKSVAAYQASRQQAQNQQARQQQIALAQQRVNQLASLHSELCTQYGDSGSIRQQLEDADSYLERLRNG